MAYRILKNACYVPEEHRVLGETGGAHRRGWRQRVLPRTRSRSRQPLLSVRRPAAVCRAPLRGATPWATMAPRAPDRNPGRQRAEAVPTCRITRVR